MPHVDELLGPVTVAAASLAVAIALQPMASRPVAETAPAATVAAASSTATAVVRLPTIEVVGRRTHEVALTECADGAGRAEREIAARGGRTHA